MLIEFKVANFQCFSDEVELSFVPAGKDRSLGGNIWKGHRYRALKSVAIFGPNASGKTSLLHALWVLRRLVTESVTSMTVGDPIQGIDPFRLLPNTRQQPSCFEILVELAGHGYRYRVEATKDRVWRERLDYQDALKHSGWLTLIDRDVTQGPESKTVLHERLGTRARRDQIIEDTRPNSLVLSRAAERNVEITMPLFEWFKDRVRHMSTPMGTPPDLLGLIAIAEIAAKDPHFLERLAMLVRDADTGIAGMHTESEILEMPSGDLEVGHDAPPEVQEAALQIRNAVVHMLEVTKQRLPGHETVRFVTEHTTDGEELVAFSLQDESEGTLRYLLICARLLMASQNSTLVIVDELDSSLHPQLARRVVRLLQSPEFNRSGAQLLFTTHDVTLMDPQLLRRDQIMLTEKKAGGDSDLHSLWDFEHMPRNDAAWAKNYLAGRFGGVPIFGASLADIQQGDEPTTVEQSLPNTTGVE